MTLLLNMTAVLNFRSLGPAMAEIVEDLGVGRAEELWLGDAYLTALICATPISGILARRYGAHKLLIACVSGIMLCAAFMSAVNDMRTLTGLLFMQGLFAGPIMPTTQGVIVSAFPPARRGFGMGVWNAGTTIGALVGSLAGGYLTQVFNWRASFLLCIPLGLLALVLVVKGPLHMAGSRDISINWGAVLLLAGGLMALGAAVNLADNSVNVSTVTLIGLALAAVVALVMFWLVNRRSAPPIFTLGALKEKTFAMAIALVMGVAVINMGLLEMEALTEVVGFDPEHVGSSGAIQAVALLVGVVFAARALSFGRVRDLLVLGLSMMAVGKFGTTLYEPGISFFAALWPPALIQAGVGILATVLAVVAFDNLAPSMIVAGTSLFVFSRVLSQALGLGAFNTLRVLRESQLVADGITQSRATALSFSNMFSLGVIISLALIPVALILGKSRGPDPNPTSPAEPDPGPTVT